MRLEDLADQVGINPALVRLQERAMPPAAGVEPTVSTEAGYAEARARRECAEADLAELELAEKSGQLIRVSAVESGLAQVLIACRDHLLQLSARLAPLLAAESDGMKVHQLLDEELHRALQYLAGGQIAPGARPAHDAPAAPMQARTEGAAQG